MKISKYSRQNAKQLFRACLVNGRMDEARARQVVNEVIAKKPRQYLPLLSHFERLVRLELQKRTARVETAIPLDDVMKQNVVSSLQRQFEPGLNVEWHVNPKLIGGLRIQVGSHVYDGSVAGKLNALKESLEKP